MMYNAVKLLLISLEHNNIYIIYECKSCPEIYREC